MRIFQQVTDEEWLNLLVSPVEDMPQLPPRDIQERFCGRFGLPAMEQAIEFYKVIRSSSERAGMPLKNIRSVLDFGCGWARISRCFLRDLLPGVLYGIDCIPKMVEYCKRIIPEYYFSLNAPTPPTSFPAGTFDIVYGYSVFSHLSEAAHQAWIKEFYRIMKPGGVLVLTTRPREFINYWPNIPYLRKIDINNALSDYDAGKLIHIPSGGGDTLSESFYGETAIPEAYIRNEWSKCFKVDQFQDNVPHIDQKVIIAMRV